MIAWVAGVTVIRPCKCSKGREAHLVGISVDFVGIHALTLGHASFWLVVADHSFNMSKQMSS